MGTTRLVAAAIVGLLLLAPAGAARAQDGRKPEAEALFKQGKAEMAKGNFDAACRMFRSSQELDPRASTLMNLGACHESAGRLFSAWYAFVEAGKTAERSLDELALAEHAKKRAESLEPRLSSLKITVAPSADVAGLEILRDGKPVLAGQWNNDVFVDGGEYTIVARAPGRTPWTTTVTIANEQEREVLAVPPLAVDAAAPAPAAAAPVVSDAVPAPVAPRPSRARKRAFGALAGGRLLNVDAESTAGHRSYSGGLGPHVALFGQYWVTGGFAVRGELGFAALSTTDQDDSTISAKLVSGGALAEYTFGSGIVQPAVLAGGTLGRVFGDVTNLGTGDGALGSTFPGVMGGLALRIAPAQLRRFQLEAGVRYWEGFGSLSDTFHPTAISGFMFHAGVSTGAGR